ncbi:MAG: ATP-binding protein [Burkholderiaceae bacterium]
MAAIVRLFWVAQNGSLIDTRGKLINTHFSARAVINRLRHLELRLGLVGKTLLLFGATALLTVVVAIMAWLSFQQVASTQQTIVNKTIPAMDAVQTLARNNTRIITLMQQLGMADTVQEVARLQNVLEAQLTHMRILLDQLDGQQFDALHSTAARSTVAAIDDNLQQQSQKITARLRLDQQIKTQLARERQAALALVTLSESLVANASTTTTATIANLYPLIEGKRAHSQVFETLDRLIEVDIDSMERMSELQLTCFNLKTLLELLESENNPDAVLGLQSRFADNLVTLRRRISDVGDPDRKLNSLAHYQTLAAAMKPDGIFAIHQQKLVLLATLVQLSGQGSVLASQLNQQAGVLVTAGGEAIDFAGNQSTRAVNRGLTGFFIVAALLFIIFITTLWILYRYHVLGRLKGMETAVQALGAGNYEIDITTASNDPLAPLSRALEQFRDNARERRRLESELLLHQHALEGQVAARTAELKQSNVLLEHEVAEHAVARQQAEEANNAKNIFLATLSHELRTPLSGVSGTVQLLRSTGLGIRQTEYTKMIDYANTMLLEILEDMLSFSRIEAGKIDFDQASFDLLETIDDMLGLQSVQAQNKGIVLIRDVEKTMPSIVFGDRRKLNQILLNIIGNAIKFTDEGSITVSVYGSTSTSGEQCRLFFTVTDTGIGIPGDQCDEVFKPFVQVKDASRHRHGGTGLGLAICRRLLEAMGGCITLESRSGEGTCVSFELDFAIAPIFPALPLESREATSPMVSRPLTVLVVEDDQINRIVCSRYLELLGHHPLLAGDRSQALALLKGQTAAIDGILMDINLPDASGLELAQEIRSLSDGRWAQIPVILMSAHVSDPTMVQYRMAETAAFLSKPFTLAALAKTLQTNIVQRTGNALLESDHEQLGIDDIAQTVALLDIGYLDIEIDTLGVKTLAELLGMFLSDLGATFTELNQAASAENWEAFGKRAHRLQSAAGNIGMTQVIDQSRQLEKMSVETDIDTVNVAKHLISLEKICHSSCDALQQKLSAIDSLSKA